MTLETLSPNPLLWRLYTTVHDLGNFMYLIRDLGELLPLIHEIFVICPKILDLTFVIASGEAPCCSKSMTISTLPKREAM